MTPAVNVKNKLSLKLYVLSKHFQPSLTFVGKARRLTEWSSPLGKAPGLIDKYKARPVRIAIIHNSQKMEILYKKQVSFL